MVSGGFLIYKVPMDHTRMEKRVERAPILTVARVQLGDDGLVLRLTVESVSKDDVVVTPDGA